jgi:hypothetical protein
MISVILALALLGGDDPLVSLDGLNEQDQIVLAGTVKHEEVGDGGGFARMIVVSNAGGGGGEPFEGAFQAWRTQDGEWVIASEQALPGVVHYDDGERTVTQVAFEDAPPATASFTGDLAGLLDFDRLRGALKKADLEKVEENGVITYRGEISKRVVSRGTGSPMQIMAPQVLRLEAELTIKDDRLSVLMFTVIRSDPLSALKKQALDGELDGGVTMSSGMPEASDEEGKRTVYTLTVKSVGAGDRVKRALKQVKHIMESEVY